MLLELTNIILQILYVEKSEATFVKIRIGCPIKAKEEIGFEAQLSLREGLIDLIEWRKLHKMKTKK